MSESASNLGPSDSAGHAVAADLAGTTPEPFRTVVVARVGRAHGLRGELTLQLRTDEPEARFAPGREVIVTDDAGGRKLVVSARRWHGERMLVRFEGISDRSAAESLRGVVLSVEVSATEVPEAADEFYDWQLEGLRVESVDGADLGVVVEVVHLPGQDLLAVMPDDEVGPESRTGPESASVLVPFVSAIVPHIDIAAGRITCDPPLGLFPPTNLVTGPPADADPGGA